MSTHKEFVFLPDLVAEKKNKIITSCYDWGREILLKHC